MANARKIASPSAKHVNLPKSAVNAVFGAYPAQVRTKLLALRKLIFDTAKTTSGVGALEETLKWGQPSYLTTESKSGSTIRIDQVKTEAGRYAVYFHCQTDLVETFRELYPELRYGGNRSILLDAGDKVPEKALRHCIALALTYHARKRCRARRLAAFTASHRARVGATRWLAMTACEGGASLTPPTPHPTACSSCPVSSTGSRFPYWAAPG